MLNQVIKTDISRNILYDFIKSACIKQHLFYIFDKSAYKKIKLLNLIEPFIQILKQHYHKSKLFYLERPMIYKNITTIIRQISNYLNVPYTSKIHYFKSTYEIKYYININ